MVIRPPRLRTSCHIKPLDCDMSTGFTMKNVAMYSTLPDAFVAASAMSVMSCCAGRSDRAPRTRAR